MSLRQLFIRWRHSRGYGIHSPYAYRLVKEAICPDRGYLYYEELTPRLAHPLTAMAYRLGIFLAQSGYRLEIIAPGSSEPDPDASESESAILALLPSEELRIRLSESLKSSGQGLLIDGRKYLLAIPRRDMAFTSYCLI